MNTNVNEIYSFQLKHVCVDVCNSLSSEILKREEEKVIIRRYYDIMVK